MPTLKLAALLALAVSIPCAAQPVFTSRAAPLNPAEPNLREVAIAASPLKPRELAIAWIGGYSISMTGGEDWSVYGEQFVPYNDCAPQVQLNISDPMALASPLTGDIYVGCLQYVPTATAWAGFSIRRKPVLVGHFTDAQTIICAQPLVNTGADKGWLTILSSGGSEIIYLGYGNFLARQVFSKRSAAFGPGDPVLWNRPSYPISDNVTAGDTGNGVANIATDTVQNGPTLLAAWQPNTDYTWIRRPVARWSDNHGEPNGSQSSWSSGISFPRAVTPGGPTDDPILEVPRSMIPGTVRFQNFPAAAKHPEDDRFVYIVFSGACQSTGEENVDLIVAKSEDGGRTFPSDLVVHVTKTMIQAPPETDQIFPTIAIDKFGGVNLFWYQVRPYSAPGVPAELEARVGWCRIGDFSNPTAALRVRYLTDWWVPTIGTYGEALGDYISACAAGCLVYCGYMRTHENTWPNIYCTRIDLCLADIDSNGLVDSLDPPAFFSALVVGAPEADINQDGQANALDIPAFLDAYTCGCGIP
jgi:hypothetical protein